MISNDLFVIYMPDPAVNNLRNSGAFSSVLLLLDPLDPLAISLHRKAESTRSLRGFRLGHYSKVCLK